MKTKNAPRNKFLETSKIHPRYHSICEKRHFGLKQALTLNAGNVRPSLFRIFNSEVMGTYGALLSAHTKRRLSESIKRPYRLRHSLSYVIILSPHIRTCQILYFKKVTQIFTKHGVEFVQNDNFYSFKCVFY